MSERMADDTDWLWADVSNLLGALELAQDERDELRERVAELEGAIRRHRDAVIDVPAVQKQFMADRELHALLPEEPTP